MAKEGEEVVPSGKALALVKKWMAAFDDDEPEELPEEPQLRPTRLGLGAKFVPHSQVLSTMNPLERKLRAKIESSRKATAGTETTSGKSSSGPHNSRKGFHGNAAPLGRGPAEEQEDTDEEEESRASAFAKRATNAFASSEGRAQNVSLADRGGQPARKKRRKKRKSGDVLGGGGGGGGNLK